MWTNIQAWIDGIIGDVSFGEQSFGHRILSLISEYGPSYLNGLWNTIIIAVIGTLAGCIIGLAVGVVQATPSNSNDHILKRIFMRIVKFLLVSYVEIFRGTPMMIQAVFIFYGLPLVFGVFWDMMPSALLIVSINTGAYMAETVRGGILSIDPGQTEGAKAIGMTHFQSMRYVILPQAVRNIMPQVGNNFIINVKDSCVLSIIGVVELFYAHRGAAGAMYEYFGSACIVMVLYFVTTFTSSRLLRYVERRMEGPSSFDLATTDTLAHTTGMYSYVEKKSDREGR